MSYYFNTLLKDIAFEDAVELLKEELAKEGFGVITETDMKRTFKTKLDLPFREYKILGACSPTYAYRALHTEDNVGVVLPCNFVIQEHDDRTIEIVVGDPLVLMSSIENEDLLLFANQIQRKIRHVIRCVGYVCN